MLRPRPADNGEWILHVGIQMGVVVLRRRGLNPNCRDTSSLFAPQVQQPTDKQPAPRGSRPRRNLIPSPTPRLRRFLTFLLYLSKAKARALLDVRRERAWSFPCSRGCRTDAA